MLCRNLRAEGGRPDWGLGWQCLVVVGGFGCENREYLTEMFIPFKEL